MQIPGPQWQFISNLAQQSKVADISQETILVIWCASACIQLLHILGRSLQKFDCKVVFH